MKANKYDAYDKALERAKELYRQGDITERLGYVFPELKESEEERIREELKHYLKVRRCQTKDNEEYINCNHFLAWLEKSADIEPKFHPGDWITTTDEEGNVTTEKIIEFWGDKVQLIDIDGFYTLWPKHELNYYHLWTIQDAKDGDVLYSIDSKRPFIYKERPQFSQARGYCCINRFGEFAIWNTSKCVICTDKYIPASKEQRDLLFQKMKEEGYEWDADKKELMKLSNEDEEIRKAIIRILKGKINYTSKEDTDKYIAWLKSID